jgi:hypothetical protein
MTDQLDDDEITSTQAGINSVLANINTPMQGNPNNEPKMITCKVGPFNLPGLIVDYNQYTAEEVTEMETWGAANGGQKMSDKLWSFRKEAKRDWFILRWT